MAKAKTLEEGVVHILWMQGGLSCDGDSVSLTAATQPSIEEIALGALPGLPKIAVHWPLIDFECGPAGGADDFLEWFWKADRGEDARVEASIAKLYSSEVLGRVIDSAVQIHGAYGVSKEFPLERWYREARVRRIGEGPSEVHRMVIARSLFR